MERPKMNALIINCSPVKNGATAEIVRIVEECIKQKYDTSSVCIDDYKFNFCKGCRSCHTFGARRHGRGRQKLQLR